MSDLQNVGNIDSVESIGSVQSVDSVGSVEKIENVDINALKRELAALRIQTRRSTVERSRAQLALCFAGFLLFALAFKSQPDDQGRQGYSWNLDIDVLVKIVTAVGTVGTGLMAAKNAGFILKNEKLDDEHIDKELTKF